MYFGLKGKHHISLCFGKHADSGGKAFTSDRKKPTASNVEKTSATHVGFSNNVLLQTAFCKVSSDSKLFFDARILFDSGSQRSYITENLKNELKLETVRTERVILRVFGQSESSARSLDVVNLVVKNNSGGKAFGIQALCVPLICEPLSNQDISIATKRFPNLRSLKLADSNHSSSDLKVDILVGMDHYNLFFTGNCIRTKGGLTANETVLGWVLSGPMCKERSTSLSSNFCSTSYVMRCAYEPAASQVSDSLRSDLERFWKIEDLQSTDDCVIYQFTKEIRFDGQRYVSHLPFRPDHEPLPDNLEVCKTRLNNLRGRLERQGLISDYDKVLKDYEDEGIIERVPDHEIYNNPCHYLPHRGVVREDKETTKLRIVFDASCANEGPSLNDCLYPGPNLICKIFDILLRFRLNPIAILSDIKQAFLNIGIDRKHQDYLRFLWMDDPFDPSSNVVIYRFLRLVFGLTSSPFILNATVRHHLEKFRDSERDFVERLVKDLYVDDSISGCFTVEEGVKFYEKSKSMLSAGGFCLRKWITNNNELQTFFDSREGIEPKMQRFIKVLGVEWDLSEDEFIFNFEEIVKLAQSIPLSKRNILRIAATFFDPLGFIAPITARVKTIFQLLCKCKSDWDSVVPEEIARVWECFITDLMRLGTLRAKRFVYNEVSEQVESVKLHGFCDSSNVCYAAVLYIKIVTTTGIKIHFLAAKTKVAPLKPPTIARLELLGCCLLSDLVKQVLEAVKGRIKFDGLYCWSDSQVALCWLKGRTKRWKPWVENRVVKIRGIVNCESWFFVEGDKNPADIPTRICKGEDFERWFRGPRFLLDEQPKVQGFDVEKKLNDVAVLNESKSSDSTILQVDNVVVPGNISNVIECSRFSSINKLLNVTALVLRFMNKLKGVISVGNISNSNCITAEERDRALKLWIKAEQAELMKEDRKHKLRNSLKLFDDNCGVSRLRGRFASSSMEYDVKHPMLLGGGERHFSKLLIMDAHKRVMHAGIESTLAFIRRRFWMIKGRKSVKSVLRNCVICKRFQGRPCIAPDSPDLPNFRFDGSFSFCNVGLDYAGPLFVREGTAKAAAIAKVYVLLFTCASSRSVHLELVPNMKIAAFLRAFTRFTSRRGRPRLVISDNFRTFKSREVQSYFANESISQRFILPSSPWWGGFYERLVRSTKLAMKKALGRSLLKYEELETVLCQAEFALNSRPLTYVSSDDLEEPLTPFHLMFGRSLSLSSNIHVFDFAVTDRENVTKRYKYMKTLVANHWRTFRNTYLNELKQHHLYRTRSKSGASHQDLRLGDVVLICDDTLLPRQRWKLGKIEELVKGRDNLIRGVKLKTIGADGNRQSCHRPLQKIIPFEITDDFQPSVTITDDVEHKQSSDKSYLDDDNVTGDDTRESTSRPKRKAAREGQLLRRLREKFNC